jgi:hypothetical protein
MCDDQSLVSELPTIQSGVKVKPELFANSLHKKLAGKEYGVTIKKSVVRRQLN